MSENPPTLTDLWEMINLQNTQTREHVSTVLREVRDSLQTFVTKDMWAAEKALMELRLERAESELKEQDRRHRDLERRIREEREAELRRAQEEEDKREAQARAEAQATKARRQNIWYRAVIPIAAVVLPVLMAWWSPLNHH
jgi:multidrug resistance efflux pump